MNFNINMDEKILYFEYIQKCMLDWYAQFNNGDYSYNDLSTLKSLKLLFFVSAAKAVKSSPNTLLDNIFTRFVAMPFGHVESDIFNEIRNRKGILNYFIIDNQTTKSISGINVEDLRGSLHQTIVDEIDESIAYLKFKNPFLVTMSAFDLVTLSHAWYSWRHNYKNAEKFGNKSHSISSDEIKSEDKIFNLISF